MKATKRTPQEAVAACIGKYDHFRNLGDGHQVAIGLAALALRVPRATVEKALAVRDTAVGERRSDAA